MDRNTFARGTEMQRGIQPTTILAKLAESVHRGGRANSLLSRLLQSGGGR